MSTTTTNLSLVKPASNENVDLSVINGNYDKIDQFAGTVVLSADVTASSGHVTGIGQNTVSVVSATGDASDNLTSLTVDGSTFTVPSTSVGTDTDGWVDDINGNDVFTPSDITITTDSTSGKMDSITINNTTYSLQKISGTENASHYLTSITIDGTSSSVPQIEANPSGTATGTLSSIGINGTNYNVSSGGGGASALNDLSDVVVSSPAAGQALIYDNTTSKWLNSALPSGNLADLGDTTITTPTDGQVLTYDSTSSKWVNGAGGGGTTVVANPSGEATADLTKLQVGNNIYAIPSGGNSKSISYLKWQILKTRGNPPAGGYLQLTEFYLYQSGTKYVWDSNVSVTSNMAGGSGEEVSKIVDGSTSTKYCTSAWGSTQANECNIVISLGETISVNNDTTYSYVTGNDEASRDPISWILYGSDDGITWDILDDRSDINITSNRTTETQQFPVDTGTTVVANPEGEATEELEKLQVGNTIYSIPSGGSGGGSGFQRTNLYTATSEGVTTIPLSDSIANYDLIEVICWYYVNDTNYTQNAIYNAQDLIDSISGTPHRFVVCNDSMTNWFDVTDVDELTSVTSSFYIKEVYGYKFGEAHTDITGTLTAGSTSITLSDNSITTSSTIEVFNDLDIPYNSKTLSTGSVTLTFDAQQSDMAVKVRVS